MALEDLAYLLHHTPNMHSITFAYNVDSNGNVLMTGEYAEMLVAALLKSASLRSVALAVTLRDLNIAATVQHLLLSVVERVVGTMAVGRRIRSTRIQNNCDWFGVLLVL